MPVLVVLGDADDVVDPRCPLQCFLALPERFRHLHVFYGIGHYQNAEVSARLAGVLSRFVAEQVDAG